MNHSYRMFVAVVGALLAFAISSIADTHYVWTNSPLPTLPYTNWLTAAHDIQSAINCAVPGETILVTNGVYDTGGTAVNSAMHRVSVSKPVRVQSIDGPAATIIVGNGPCGVDAVRCAYVGANAILAGFTLSNGCTLTSGDLYMTESGGGVWCEQSGLVTNCTLLCNSAIGGSSGGGSCSGGGGAYGGTLSYCTLSGNSTTYGGGGGAYNCTLNYCTLSGNSAYKSGGGAWNCTLNNCSLSHNTVNTGYLGGSGGGSANSTLTNCKLLSNNSNAYGGGSYGDTLYNCVLAGNYALADGGGAYNGNLNNCTVSGNSCSPAAGRGGGTEGGTLNNCIIFSNSAAYSADVYAGMLNYCCAPVIPLPCGPGNITNDPCFVSYESADYHLSTSSMCINAGNNASATNATDLDGNPRIQASVVDMGAYESPYAPIDAWAGSAGTISPAGRVGVPVSGNQAFAITSKYGFAGIQAVLIDGVSIGPTNSYTFVNLTSNHTIEAVFWLYPDPNGCSICGMNMKGSNGLVLRWTGTNGWTYNLQKSPSLIPPAWSNASPYTNISGAGSIVITNNIGAEAQAYYRLMAVEN